MESIHIRVEYPSGLVLENRASLSPELQIVDVCERTHQIMRLLDVTEAPPTVTATIDGQTVQLERRVDGAFDAALPAVGEARSRGMWERLVGMVQAPSKDQRQQFGRFLHTLSAASLIGLIGYWHSTSNWTLLNVLNEVNLFLAFVLTFYIGMVAINGE